MTAKYKAYAVVAMLAVASPAAAADIVETAVTNGNFKTLTAALQAAGLVDGEATGTDERPDLSATLVIQVTGLTLGRGARLTGPGIEGEAQLDVVGAPALWPGWRANAGRFPRGVDVVLCAGVRLAALPRTTRVEA